MQATSALPDGVEYRFPTEWAPRLLELIEKERACCTSIAFELRFEPAGGPVLLRLRGDEDATDFLASRLAPAGQGDR